MCVATVLLKAVVISVKFKTFFHHIEVMVKFEIENSDMCEAAVTCVWHKHVLQ